MLHFTGDEYRFERNIRLAEKCYEAGEYESALSHYEEALLLNNTEEAPYLGMTEVYMAQEAYGEAISSLQAGITNEHVTEERKAVLKDRLSEVCDIQYEQSEKYPMQMVFFDAENDTALEGVKVSCRRIEYEEGGDTLFKTKTDENGIIRKKLPEGTYIIEAELNGYMAACLDASFTKEDTVAEGYLVPRLAEGTTAVVLTWEGEETDLDLVVFTPHL